MIRTLSPASVVLGLVAGAAACSSPSGPVAPTLVDSPQTPVVLTPELAAVLSVPSVPDSQRYDYTEDGQKPPGCGDLHDRLLLSMIASIVPARPAPPRPRHPCWCRRPGRSGSGRA